MITKLITEINEALSHNLYFAALSLALTLPDICGKAEYPDKGSTSRYKLWYDEYIGLYEKSPSIDGVPDMPYLSGEIVYNFRSSLFHQGNPNLDNDEYKKRNKKECPIEHFKIVVETEKPYKIYGGEAGTLTIDNNGIEHREYSVSVRRLCLILCLAAESYYNKNKDKFTFFNYSILDWDKYIASLPKEDRDMMLEETLTDIEEKQAKVRNINMDENKGVIYILTNPSFPQYVKIGYADNVESRLKQLNNSECIPFAFRVYATYEVEERLTDVKLHSLIDQLNPDLRSIDEVDGKKRVREFYAMSKEQAYAILETIAVLGGRKDRLHLYEPTTEEKKNENLAQEIEEEHIERLSPFAFSKCKIPVGATITFIHQGNANSGAQCTVVDDKMVDYQGRRLSLSALATELTGSKRGVAGPRYFKYDGVWLNELRAKEEGWKVTSRLDDVWIIPCNPKYYDIVAAFDNLDVIEWSQSTNTTVGDTVYIYVGEKYKSIMFKCEVIGADLYGNRSTDDFQYYKELAKDPDARYMKLKLVEKYPVGQYPLKELKENGLASVQGRSKATVQLMKYLNDRK